MKELFNVKENELKLAGYMLYKIRKCINFYLFFPIKDYDEVISLKSSEGYQIAKVYEGNVYELEDGRYLKEVD